MSSFISSFNEGVFDQIKLVIWNMFSLMECQLPARGGWAQFCKSSVKPLALRIRDFRSSLRYWVWNEMQCRPEKPAVMFERFVEGHLGRDSKAETAGKSLMAEFHLQRTWGSSISRVWGFSAVVWKTSRQNASPQAAWVLTRKSLELKVTIARVWRL